jgi:hypothetical protein
MSETYQKKVVRWERTRAAFPPPLDRLVPYRCVDAVLSLSSEARDILAEAVTLLGSSKYVAQMAEVLKKETPVVNASDLLAFINVDNIVQGKMEEEKETASTDRLIDLLLKCYPNMPQPTAEALAASDLTEDVRTIVRLMQKVVSNTASDFIVVTVYTLFEEILDEIKEIINSNQAYVKAMRLSRPDWSGGIKK